MKPNDFLHTPVLLDEVINGLEIRPNGFYVDCTFGRGGHSRAILDRLENEGRVLAFDKDPVAAQYAERLSIADSRLQFIHTTFARLAETLKAADSFGLVDGILLDLGVSSPQLEDGDRGFSFNCDGKLDMRMDNTTGITAAEWVNSEPQEDIASVLKQYGEERYARRISNAIVKARATQPINSTSELASVISSAVPVHKKNKHPATRSFLAIRNYINNELDELVSGLSQAFDAIKIGGRILVISFNSLEDRITKRFLRGYSQNDPFPKNIPITANTIKPKIKIIGKIIRPSEDEVLQNPRSRSAVLRIGEKLSA